MVSSARSFVVVTAVVGVGLVVACSKKGEDAIPCETDIECPQGSLCRDSVCLVINTSDAGGADGEVPIPCVSPGSSCSRDVECCAGTCTSSGRCSGTPGGTSGKSSGSSGSSGGSGTSGTSGTSSGGSCVDIYGLCAGDFDCCPGLSCTQNACR